MSKCTNCGFELPSTAKFCDNCGAKVVEIPAPQTQTQQPQPQPQQPQPQPQQSQPQQSTTNSGWQTQPKLPQQQTVNPAWQNQTPQAQAPQHTPNSAWGAPQQPTSTISPQTSRPTQNEVVGASGTAVKQKGKKPYIFIIIGVVALAVIATIITVIINAFSFFSSATNTDELSGKYILSSMTTAGISMSYSDLQISSVEMILEITGDSAMLTAYGSTSPVDLDLSTNTIEIDGVPLSFVIDGDDIIASGEAEGITMQLVFTAESSLSWDEIKQESGMMDSFLGGGEDTSDNSDLLTSEFVAPGIGTEETMYVETLSSPSDWYGSISISNYSGASDISGEYEAWAYIGEDELGTYFELYVDGPYGSGYESDFLSFSIDLYDYSFFPIVDEHAWLYGGATLVEGDDTWFVPVITNGVLSGTYDYNYNGESFTIDFEIAQIVGSTSSDTGETDTDSGEGDSTTDESTPAPTASFTTDELREKFLAMEDLDGDAHTVMTYEEIRDTYFDGIDGEIQYDDPDFKSYLWRSVEAETSYVYISFEEDDSGVINYTSMTLANISRDE